MTPNWLSGNKNQTSEPVQSNAVVRIIGDRSSGKTTYMASLAYWPNANPNSPVQSVTPINEDGEELIYIAKDILEQGAELGNTSLINNVLEIKDYSLSITLKDKFSWGRTQIVRLNISCKDYSGEFFSDLLNKQSDPMLREYLDDCFQATGIMFLIDGTAYSKDKEYANGLDKLLNELDNFGRTKRQIAVVLTKCEQSELWINRHSAKDLVSKRFPKVVEKLKYWKDIGGISFDYFTTSAFGMLGNLRQTPNSKLIARRKGGVQSVIKEPKFWRPFGLVAPIYWLCTGNRHKDLDKD